MPITQINGQPNYQIVPLSNGWTHQAIISEAMVLTNTLDNEAIQLHSVRVHLNMAISYLAELLRMNTTPFYGVYMEATLETAAHPSGLEWINMGTPLGTLVPNQIVSEIKRINSHAIAPYAAPVLNAVPAYDGNWTSWDLSNLTQQNNTHNIQHRFSVAWHHHGSEILIFVGNLINTPQRDSFLTSQNITPGFSLKDTDAKIVIWSNRQPRLDDLLPTSNTASIYYQNVDVPDKYVKLLIQLVQKSLLEQQNAQVPAQLEADINQAVVAAQSSIQAELALEAADREKRKYGNPQKGMQ